MAEIQTKRYPIRGALWGLLLGIAIAYFATFEFAWIGFDEIGRVGVKLLIIIGATMVVGVLWAYVAPARKPKGEPPAGYVGDAPPAAVVDESPPPAPIDETPPAAPIDETPPAAPIDDEPPAAAGDDEPPAAISDEEPPAAPTQ